MQAVMMPAAPLITPVNDYKLNRALDAIAGLKDPLKVCQALVQDGWKPLGNGSYKFAFKKGKYVFKVAGVCDESFSGSLEYARVKNVVQADTIQTWLAFMASLSDEMRLKHFPRVYYATPMVIVQEFVPNTIPLDGFCEKDYCKHVARILRLRDADHNHGHYKGEPVFYDGQPHYDILHELKPYQFGDR